VRIVVAEPLPELLRLGEGATRHRAGVRAASLSPDGAWIATADWGHEVVIRQAADLRPVRRFIGGAEHLCWFPDGRRLLASGHGLSVLRLDGAPAERPDLPKEARGCVALCAGRLLIVSDSPGQLSVLDLQGGWRLGRIRPEGGAATGLAISPCGRHVAVTSGVDRVARFALPELMPLPQYPAEGQDERCVAYSPSGETLATGGKAGLRVWDVETGASQLFEWRYPIEQIAFSPSGGLVAGYTDLGGDACVWRAATGELVCEIRGRRGSGGLAFLEERTLAVGVGHAIRRFDVGTGEPLDPWPAGHDGAIGAIALDRGHGRIFLAGVDHRISAWDRERGAPAWTVDAHAAAIEALTVSTADGALLSISSAAELRVSDPEDGGAIAQLRAEGSGATVAVAPDGGAFATEERGRVQLWDARTRTRGSSFRAHRGPIARLAWLVRGAEAHLASTDARGRLRGHRAADGRLGREVASVRSEVIAASEDGRRLAVGRVRSVEVWDADRLEPIGSFECGLPAAVALGADGLVAIAAFRGPVDVFEQDTGRHVGRCALGEPAASLALTRDGCLVVGWYDGTASVCELPDRLHALRRRGEEAAAVLDGLVARRAAPQGYRGEGTRRGARLDADGAQLLLHEPDAAVHIRLAPDGPGYRLELRREQGGGSREGDGGAPEAPAPSSLVRLASWVGAKLGAAPLQGARARRLRSALEREGLEIARIDVAGSALSLELSLDGLPRTSDLRVWLELLRDAWPARH